MGSAAVKVSRRDVAAVVAAGVTGATTVGRCCFTLSNPVLKAPSSMQGLTLDHVRALLQHIQDTFMGQLGSRGAQRRLKLS
jgi:hypothetical protein